MISNKQIDRKLYLLQKEYQFYEALKPAAGYCVSINTTNSFQAKITPYGTRLIGTPLSGFEKGEDLEKNCPFCQTTDRIIRVFNEWIALKSLSNQILVVPKKHYPHWFSIPPEKQKELFLTILSLRKEYQQEKRPIEFHCGSAAGQTVFHFHGRTGIYV